MSCLVSLLNKLLEKLEVDGLGALNGVAKSTVPNQLRERADGTRNTEQDSVEVSLGETVVVENAAGVSIDVGPGVLGLTVLGEDTRHDLVDEGNELEELVVGHVLQSEDTLRSVARISLAEDGVTEARNDLTSAEGLPSEIADGLSIDTLARSEDALLGLEGPFEHLLVSKTVERTSETSHTSSESEVGVRESRANKADAVSGDVTTLVIGVNGEVETHVLIESISGLLSIDVSSLQGLTLGAETDHAVERGSDIEVAVDIRGETVAEGVVVDHCSDAGELSNDVQSILESGFPVVLLVSGVVLLSEDRLGLTSSNCGSELSHRVHGLGEVLDHVLDVSRDLAALVEILGHELDLLVSGNLTGHEEPESSLGERLTATTAGAVSTRKSSLELRNAETAVTDTLFSIKQRGLPEHALDGTHTTNELADGDLIDDLITIGLVNHLKLLTVLGDELLHALLQQVHAARLHRGLEVELASDAGDAGEHLVRLEVGLNSVKRFHAWGVSGSVSQLTTCQAGCPSNRGETLAKRDEDSCPDLRKGQKLGINSKNLD